MYQIFFTPEILGAVDVKIREIVAEFLEERHQKTPLGTALVTLGTVSGCLNLRTLVYVYGYFTLAFVIYFRFVRLLVDIYSGGF